MAWAGRRFGTVKVLTLGFVIASVIMMITPVMTNSMSSSLAAFRLNFASRIIIGFAQGGTYPLLVGSVSYILFKSHHLNNFKT